MRLLRGPLIQISCFLSQVLGQEIVLGWMGVRMWDAPPHLCTKPGNYVAVWPSQRVVAYAISMPKSYCGRPQRSAEQPPNAHTSNGWESRVPLVWFGACWRAAAVLKSYQCTPEKTGCRQRFSCCPRCMFFWLRLWEGREQRDTTGFLRGLSGGAVWKGFHLEPFLSSVSSKLHAVRLQYCSAYIPPKGRF